MVLDDIVQKAVLDAGLDAKAYLEGAKAVEKANKKIAKSSKDVVNNQKKVKQQFDYSLLSFMFAGMAINRIGKRIVDSSLNTFTKISQGAGEAGKAMTALSAEWTFLKFEVGKAIGTVLGPLVPILTKIIRGFAKFTAQHPVTVFAGIASVLAVGGTLSVMGQVGMFLQGLHG